MDSFRQDILDLFDRKRGGHVQHWLYSSEEGSDLWKQFYKSSKDYYIPHDETRLIQQKGAALVAQSHADSIVDFGVGSKEAVINKVMPIIRGLSNVQLYSGVDVSEDFLEQGRQAINDHCPGMLVETHQKDFHADRIPLSGNKKLGLLFGCSVTNQEMLEGGGLPHKEIIKNLSDFRTHLGDAGEMLLTYDENPDGDHAMGAYDSPYWSDHVTGLMALVEQGLQTGGDFSAKNWHHKRVWDPDAHVIHQCLVSTRPQTLEIDDKEYHFKKGERFVAVNNFKFTRPDFKGFCEDAGYVLGRSAKEKTIRLQHLSI